MTSLLYGPRQPRKHSFDSFAGAAEARRMVNRIGKGKSLKPMIKIIVDRHDIDPTANVVLLINGLADNLDYFNELSWQELLDGIDGFCQDRGLGLLREHLEIYFDQLLVKERLTPEQIDFIIANQDAFKIVYRQLIAARPAAAFAASLRMQSGTDLRGEIYHQLFDDLGHSVSIDYRNFNYIFIEQADVVREDIANSLAPKLPEAIELACRNSGMLSFAGQKLSFAEASVWLRVLDSNSLDRCEIALRSFVLSAKQPVINHNQVALGVDSDQRISDALAQISAALPRAIIENRAALLIKKWSELWIDLITEQIKPADFGSWPPSLVDPDRSLDLFRREYLSRTLLPDRRLSLDERQWRAVLSQSLISRRDNPLALYIDRTVLAGQLQRIYNRRRSRQDWILAPDN